MVAVAVAVKSCLWMVVEVAVKSCLWMGVVAANVTDQVTEGCRDDTVTSALGGNDYGWWWGGPVARPTLPVGNVRVCYVTAVCSRPVQ